MSPFEKSNSRLEVKVDEEGYSTLITLRGTVDEESDFTKLDAAKNRNLVFDLGGIELINSVGIRGWVNWMKANRQRNYTFRNCSKPVTDQINVLEGFLPPSSIVESFYVPYICENCDKGHDVLFRKSQEFERATADHAMVLNEPKVMCDKCGGPMEMDVVEAKYFRFLRYR